MSNPTAGTEPDSRQAVRPVAARAAEVWKVYGSGAGEVAALRGASDPHPVEGDPMSWRYRRRTALFGFLLLALFLPAGPALGTPPAKVRLRLPAPTEDHPIGTVSLHLVDASRPDPWVPAQRVRQLMIQIWYPAATTSGYPIAPWMSPATVPVFEKLNGLPSGVLDWPATHAHIGAPIADRSGGRPVILYSHGLGSQRFDNTALVEDLASHGYIVVTVDHVHDANVVELPNGRVETSAIPELTKANEVQVTTKAVEARVADTRFVLDVLSAIDRGDNPDAEHRPLPRGLRGALDLRHVGMMGHSDGGTTTAAMMHIDRRIAVGVNLDGTFWTPDSVAGSDRPMLVFGREDQNRTTDPTWATFWANQRGPKLQLNLAGSMHGTFEDVVLLIPQAAAAVGMSPDHVAKGVGTINGQRAASIVHNYVTAYFDRYLRHHDSDLLDGPSPRYPEVTFTP